MTQPSVYIVFLKRFDIRVKFVNSSDPAAFAAAIDDKTKAIYVESIGNPKYNVSPLPELAKVRPPINCRRAVPAEMSTHSMTGCS